MRLKNIKLAGFKSFVEPTTVPLPSPLVAVVGPNGCGKSNVIDAVRWVMGESSAKYLRGESMADVIFNGSTGRKPVGQASIELHFNNSDGWLGGEYASYAEIAIRRTVTRDGQSTYYLNGSRCRRRDVTDIFLGTGLGPRSYAIIEQGTISRLIEAKPEELRVYIEEAAGISKYKERRRETELRIEHTRENLTRLSDIRDELGKQLSHLQRQAKAAERYKLLKQEERLLKAQLLALRWRILDQQTEQQSYLVAEKEVQLEGQIGQQQALEAQHNTLRESQQAASLLYQEIQARYYEVGSNIARLEEMIKQGRARVEQLKQDSEQAERAWQETQQHLQDDEKKIAELIAQKAQCEPEWQQANLQVEQDVQALAQADQAMRTWQSTWDTFNQQAAAPAQQAQVEQTRIQHLEQRQQALQQRLDRLNTELGQLNGEPIEKEIQILQEKMAQLLTQQTEGEKQLAELVEQMTLSRQLIQSHTSALDVARHQLNDLNGRHVSLQALQQNALGQGKQGVMDWLKRHELSKMSRVGENLKVTEGWECAVETVLGSYLQALCVDSLDAIVEHLPSLTKGELVVLSPIVGATLGSSANSRPGTLSTYVQSSAVSSLLEGIYVAEDVSDALAKIASLDAHESIITRDGVWLGANWLRVTRDPDEKTGMLKRAKELEELQRLIAELQTQVNTYQQNIEDERSRLKQWETEREQRQRQQTEQAASHSDLRAKLQIKQGQMDQVRQRTAHIETETQDIAKQMTQSLSELTAAREAWATALAQMEQDTLQREELLKSREHYTQQLQTIRQQTQTHRELAHQLDMRLKTASTQYSSLQNNHERLKKQVLDLQERRASLIDTIATAEAPLEIWLTELTQHIEERAQIETQQTAAQEGLKEIEQSVLTLEKKQQETQGMTLEIRTKLEQHRVEYEGLQVKRQGIHEQIVESGADLETLLTELPEEIEEKQWQFNLQQISEKLERLGLINLAAIDEYTAQAERKVYLDEQDTDLVQALHTLEDAIRKIDRETRTRFTATYEQVNESFQTLFPRVFGGGRASLALTSESDVLSTGITVMAQPPGKRNSTIHLLSGGEKALTALALVFAIFQLNPAPFCMLDEVDAPLDDVNVGRFCALVQEMSKTTQFIFITHNKLAMQMAQHLIGVTMKEPGVSRLVAVSVEEALQALV